MAYFNGKQILLAGLKGKPGISPHIGSNGNWFVGEHDTGVNAGGSGSSLPAVSIGDDGKMLQVVNGVWTIVENPLMEEGITAPAAGFFTLHVDDDGNLWAYCEDDADLDFEYDPATGNLYIVQEES